MLFRIVFSSFLKIPAEIKNTRLKLPLATPTGASITVAYYGIEMLPLVADNLRNEIIFNFIDFT